jgi:ATP-dependent RNA helicase DeaD
LVDQAASFADFKLQSVTRNLVARMGFSVPTPIQVQAIPALLDGRDVVGQARTGSGKTLAFALPMVDRCAPKVRSVQALVLAPTRELAIQIGGVLRPLASARRLSVTLVYGGRSVSYEHTMLLKGTQIVVGTPGRTLDHLERGNLLLGNLRVLVLDECDEMLDLGFAADVEAILAKTPAERQTALFSATVPQWVMKTADNHLCNPIVFHEDREIETPPEIKHIVYEVDPGAKFAALRTLLDRRGNGPILVFGRTKHGVKKLAGQLGELGYPVAALQGNLRQKARERVMASFRSGEVPILLATNVAARGLDVEGIEQVINYELPESAQLFTHRAGRTGRMGRYGETITFITPQDGPKWREIQRDLGRRMPPKSWPDSPTPTPPGKSKSSPVRSRAKPPTGAVGSDRRRRARPKA